MYIDCKDEEGKPVPMTPEQLQMRKEIIDMIISVQNDVHPAQNIIFVCVYTVILLAGLTGECR
jgi:hypothetical protein